MTDHPVLRLRKNQDRRVRAGHPWIFSNEIDAVEGEPPDGSIVDVIDSRGAYLGRGYVNRHSLIAARHQPAAAGQELDPAGSVVGGAAHSRGEDTNGAFRADRAWRPAGAGGGDR